MSIGKLNFFLVLNEKTNEKRIHWMAFVVKYLFKKKKKREWARQEQNDNYFVTIRGPFIFFVLFALHQYWKHWNPIRQTVSTHIFHIKKRHNEWIHKLSHLFCRLHWDRCRLCLWITIQCFRFTAVAVNALDLDRRLLCASARTRISPLLFIIRRSFRVNNKPEPNGISAIRHMNHNKNDNNNRKILLVKNRMISESNASTGWIAKW